MSTLFVESVKFDVVEHENADKLCIAKIRDKAWQCVFNKEQWGLEPGDTGEGVYFPIDSVLPQDLIERHNLGKIVNNGRIKSVRLRGELSQGLLLPFGDDIPKREVGTLMTKELGVTKWEPTIPISLEGEVEIPPQGWQKYTDIENIKNFPNIFSEGEKVVVTEKLHGANIGVMKQDGKIYVSSRNRCVKDVNNNVYWRAINPILNDLLEILDDGDILFGELLGVQELKYGYEKGVVGVRFFDLCKSGQYVDYEHFSNLIENTLGREYLVPLMYWGPYSYEKVKDLAHGDSIMSNHIREGVVIKPDSEDYDRKLGRVILKFISDDYLTSKGKKTEYH